MTEPRTTARSTDEPAVRHALSKSADGSRGRLIGGRSASAPHAHRFRTAILSLAVVAVVAVGIAVVAVTHGRRHATASLPWSAWSPADSGIQGARDIADFIGPMYRATAADQLAVITVINLESTTAAEAAQQAAAAGTSTSSPGGLQVAVRPSASSTEVSLLNGNTIAYNLCGVGGKNCAIGVGKPSTNRLLLLRREALELALYTFKYIGGTQNVVAILPPGRTEAQTGTLSKTLPTTDSSASKPLDIALLFERQELSPFLSQPLATIMPEEQPPTVAEMPEAPEAELVSEVTARGLFAEQLQQTQDGSSLIVLDPLPAQ